MSNPWQKLACSTCGGGLEYKGNLLVCKYCKSSYEKNEDAPESLIIQLNGANVDKNRFRFDDAFEKYALILKEYPADEEANWGAFLCAYGVIYEEDYDGRYKPTCHRLSERPVEKSPYYAHLNAEQKRKAAEIEKLRQKILAETKKVQPYDVFICYKQNQERSGVSVPTREAKWARDVYETLTKQGLRVFYAEKSLAGSNTDYEPHIYAALRSAKLMLVLTTSLEHLHSVWVANEWKRYVSYIRAGEDKTVRVVYDSIEPYDLPKELQAKQAIDQDGDWISAIHAAVAEIFQKAPELQKRRAYGEKTYARREVQATQVQKRQLQTFERTTIPASESTQLKTAESMMSVGEYKGATAILRGVLAANRACAKAYLDLFLCENACADGGAFIEDKKPISDFSNFESALACAENGEKMQIENMLYNRALKDPQICTIEEYVSLPTVEDKRVQALIGVADGWANQNKDERLFGYIIQLVNDTDAYIRYNFEFGKSVFEKSPKSAEKYFANVLAVDEGHRSALLYSLMLKMGAKSADDLFEKLLKSGDFSEIEKILEYGEYEELRIGLENAAIKAIQNKRIKEGVRLADFVLSIIPEKRETLYLESLEKIKNQLLKAGGYTEMGKYLDALLAINPNNDRAYFEKVLAKNKTNDVLRLTEIVDTIMEDEDFLNAISARVKNAQSETENLYMRVYKQLVFAKKKMAELKFSWKGQKEVYAYTAQEFADKAQELEKDLEKICAAKRVDDSANFGLILVLSLMAFGGLLWLIPQPFFTLLHWGWYVGVFVVAVLTAFVIGCIHAPTQNADEKTKDKLPENANNMIKGVITILCSFLAAGVMIFAIMSGTLNDRVYHLRSAWDFNLLSNVPFADSADFVVENDIDFKGKAIPKLQESESGWYPGFMGSFDGQGHTLKNIKVNATKESNGILVNDNCGKILNVTFENVEVIVCESYGGDGVWYGYAENSPLVDWNYGTIKNVTLKNYKASVPGRVFGYETYGYEYALLLRQNYGKVENCRLYDCAVTLQTTGEKLGYSVVDYMGWNKGHTYLNKIEVYNSQPLPEGETVYFVRETYDRYGYNYLHLNDLVYATPNGSEEKYRSEDTEWVTSKWGEYPTPCTGFDD